MKYIYRKLAGNLEFSLLEEKYSGLFGEHPATMMGLHHPNALQEVLQDVTTLLELVGKDKAECIFEAFGVSNPNEYRGYEQLVQIINSSFGFDKINAVLIGYEYNDDKLMQMLLLYSDDKLTNFLLCKVDELKYLGYFINEESLNIITNLN